MKYFFFFSFLTCYMNGSFAQKPAIDTRIFDSWYTVQRDIKISNNGNYISYTISNKPVKSRQKLVIQSVTTSWKVELERGGRALFTDDSRWVLFFRGKDSLCLFSLDRKQIELCINNVNGFQLFKRGNEEWLAYQLKEPERQLVLRSMRTGKEEVLFGVIDYILSSGGTALAFRMERKAGDITIQSLNWINLSSKTSKRRKIIGEYESILDFRFDNSGTQLAFVEGGNDGKARSIWYYRFGMDSAVILVDDKIEGIDSSLEVESLSNFSIDGERLFFTLRKKDYATTARQGVEVDIWSYKDAKLQSQQLLEDAAGAKRYNAVIAIKNGYVIRLQNEDEEAWVISNDINDDWVLVTHRKGDKAEESWNKLSESNYYLMSVKTGERKQVKVPFAGISPKGKYLIGSDDQGNIFTYEINTGIIYDISKSISIPKGNADDKIPVGTHHRGVFFSGHWLLNDTALLVYDEYDIWQLDPKGITPPVNLTNGYGRRSNITFRLIDDDGRVYMKNDSLIMDAFNNRNKNNGFYATVLGKVQNPTVLTMGPYVFYAESKAFVLNGMRPIKARDAVSYVVLRCSIKEAPNYFWTSDFKKFIPLSYVYPEKRYNWLQSELISFTTSGDSEIEGVLYKPENFDQRKKYPVLIHYYEKKTDLLNQYLPPGFSSGDINIPFFVSRGYLVFTPDIHYSTGEIGENAYNSIMAAREYLVGLPWVDSKRIGISGHSFGGFETNYIITRSNLFAAACSDAGVVNFASQYGNYILNMGISLQALCERGQNRMGTSLWRGRDLYIRNSPIFQVEKVTTPVLLISNRLDEVVHFAQGIQFFTALRRSGKRAWMLQYDKEGHNLLQRDNQMDLSIKVAQFFDHYLKGQPTPKWMTKGIPARIKQN